MKDALPWALTQRHYEPIGLREAVARVAFLTPAEARGYAERSKKSLMKVVAHWRLHQPTKFAELCAVMGIKFARHYSDYDIEPNAYAQLGKGA